MEPQPTSAIELFISYAHEDKDLCEKLITHLASLKREGLINRWYDREINAGEEWHEEIVEQLRRATIILLLVSPDFIKSEYINDVEVKEAMERHMAGLARAIPVILRPADWKGTLFSKLQALPTSALPITSWTNEDEAFVDIVQGIRKAIGERPVHLHGCKGVPDIPRAPAVGFVPRKDRRGHNLVRQLKEMLAPDEPRFIMLSGLEGVGKTKLAAEVARQLEADYKKCIVWSDPARRVDYTIQSLLDDITTQTGHSALRTLPPDVKEERVREFLNRQPTLVVLDNYEMVMAEDLEHIDELFERSRCSVLYVSLRMEEGGKTNKVMVMVPPMWPDESDELIQRLVEWTQNPEVFTIDIRLQIHGATDGRPALIEWVVRQIDAAPEEPEEVFRKVARGEGDVLQRIFNRSFELLGKDGHATLLALSLFPSSVSLEALGSVAGLNEKRIKEAVRDLRTLMLIEIDTTERLLGFTTKPITRNLAEKSLLTDKRTAAKYWRNFVKYYRVQVDKYDWSRDELLTTPVTERSKILRAMQFAPYIEEWDTLMELYCKTKGYIHSFNVWRKAIDLAEREAEKELGDNENLSLPIIIEIKHRDIKKVRKCYEELKKKSSKLGDKILKKSERNPALVLKRSELIAIVELSVVEFELGVFAYHEGRHSEARRHYEKAKRYKELAKDWRGFATVCNNLGVAIAKEKKNGWMEQADKELNEALKNFKKQKSNFTKVGSRNLKWLKEQARRA